MPLTHRTITVEAHRLTCDQCEATIEAMDLGTLASQALLRGWDVPAPLPPLTMVQAICPDCQRKQAAYTCEAARLRGEEQIRTAIARGEL